MATVKISQITSSKTNVETTDKFEIEDASGVSHQTTLAKVYSDMVRNSVVAKTVSYDITDSDGYTRIEVDTTSGDITIKVPTNTSNANRQIEIAHVKGGTNKVIITATDGAVLTSDALSAVWLPKIGDFVKLQCSATSGFWEVINEKITSVLKLNTYAGYGDASNNKIMRFTNVDKNLGNMFNENHVSGYSGNTKGLEITINRSRKYAFEFTNHPTGGTNNIGFSINSTQLTTDIAGLTAGVGVGIVQSLSNIPAASSVVLDLVKGDVIRFHTAGVANTTYAANASAVVTYLG